MTEIEGYDPLINWDKVFADSKIKLTVSVSFSAVCEALGQTISYDNITTA